MEVGSSLRWVNTARFSPLPTASRGARASGTDRWWLAVAAGTDSYAAVGDGGTVLLSSDGITWAEPPFFSIHDPSWRINGVVWTERAVNADQYWAVGENGLVVRSTSFDAKWVGCEATVGTLAWLRGLVSYEQGVYAVGRDRCPGGVFVDRHPAARLRRTADCDCRRAGPVSATTGRDARLTVTVEEPQLGAARGMAA